MNVMFGQDFLNGFQPGLDDLVVIGGAVLAEEVFQHIRRDDRVLLQPLGQVFAHNQAGEVLDDFLVQRAQLAVLGDKGLGWFSRSVSRYRVGSRLGIHSKSVVKGFCSFRLWVL